MVHDLCSLHAESVRRAPRLGPVPTSAQGPGGHRSMPRARSGSWEPDGVIPLRPPGSGPQHHDLERPWWGLGDVAVGIVAAQFLSVAVVPGGLRPLGGSPAPSAPLWAGGAAPDPPVGRPGGLDGVGRRTARAWGCVEDFGLSMRALDAPLGLVIGVLCQLVLLPVVYWPLLQLLGQGRGRPVRAGRGPCRTAPRSTAGWVVLAVMVVVGAPIVEELFYRGLVLRSLEKRGWPDVGRACWGRRACSRAMHFQALQFPGLFVFGVVLAVLALRTGRLGLPIVGPRRVQRHHRRAPVRHVSSRAAGGPRAPCHRRLPAAPRADWDRSGAGDSGLTAEVPCGLPRCGTSCRDRADDDGPAVMRPARLRHPQLAPRRRRSADGCCRPGPDPYRRSLPLARPSARRPSGRAHGRADDDGRRRGPAAAARPPGGATRRGRALRAADDLPAVSALPGRRLDAGPPRARRDPGTRLVVAGLMVAVLCGVAVFACPQPRPDPLRHHGHRR